MANDDERSGGWYMHTGADEANLLKAKVKSAICTHKNEDDLYEAYEGSSVSKFSGAELLDRQHSAKKAKRQLWAIVVRQIKVGSLITYISTNHPDDGKGALDYIVGCFAAGVDKLKLKATDKQYLTYMREGIPSGATAEEAVAILTKMTNLRDSLKDTKYEISDKRHSCNLIHMVEERGKAHSNEVRMQDAALADDIVKQVTKVSGVLDGILRAVEAAGGEEDRARTVRTMLVDMGVCADVDEASVLLAQKMRSLRGGRNENASTTKCEHCHLVHPGKAKDCYAFLLSKGTLPPGWDKWEKERKKRTLERAEAISPGCTQTHNLQVLICDNPLKSAAAKSGPIVEVLVDTQAHPEGEFHFVNRLDIFVPDSLQPLDRIVHISGVGEGSRDGVIGGTIELMHPESGRTLRVEKCVYVPQFPATVLNPVLLEKRGTAFDFTQRRLTTRDGVVIGLDRQRISFEARVVSPSSAGRSASVLSSVVETVQRGARGKLHIDASAMTGAQRAEFELQHARLNDPPYSRLHLLSKVADGVPEILAKANEVNTTTITRLLADPPTSAPIRGSTPVAERAGQVTQTDGWKGPCKSFAGNTYMITQYDNFSINIEVYPTVSKAKYPEIQDEYFLYAKYNGVDIDRGGMLWSDNEIVINSMKMDEVLAKHEQTRGNSIEYEATGNSGAESTFRILGHEMRKSLIRAGTPESGVEQFWDFAAIDAAELMKAARAKVRGELISPGEKFDGRRRDLSRRRVWGCYVIAKVPHPWLQNKMSPRGVEGINLGRVRGKPGYAVWTPMYGIFNSKHVTFFERRFPFQDGTFSLSSPRQSTGGGGGGGVAAAPAVPVAEATSDYSDDDDDEDDPSFVPGDSDSDSDSGDDDDGPWGTPTVRPGWPDISGDDSEGSGPGLGGSGSPGGASGGSQESSPTPRDALGGSGDLSQTPRDGQEGSGDPPQDPSQTLEDGSEGSEEASQTPSDYWRRSPDPSSAEHESDATWSETHLVRVLMAAVKENPNRVVDDIASVMMSTAKKSKKQREQTESGIPPPWMPLRVAPKHIRELFEPAERKEIDGILGTKSAYEVVRDTLPAGTKVYETHTLRDKKKNGPKKGQAKVRVVVNKGPEDVESHSPTVQMATLRALLALMAAKRAKGAAGDFPQAYLNADQDVYYVWPPKSARQYDDDGQRLVWALPKALYGGRASGRHWYKMLRNWFVEHGFKVSEWDPCLFLKRNPDGTFHYVAVYVDDLVHVYTDEVGYQSTIEQFSKDFHGYSDLGPLTEIFNAEVDCNSQFVTMTQTRYIDTLVKKWLPENFAKAYVPAVCDGEGALLDVIKAALADDAVRLDAEKHSEYREIVGAILYLATVCRPDVAVAVGLLSRVLEKPTAAAHEAAMRVLRYLATTKELGLRWAVGSDTTLSGMSDADWSVVKSTSGYIFFLAKAAIAYIAKKQASIAMSSTESEIMAASLAALEAIFLRGLLSEVGCVQEDPTVIGIDNQGAIALSKNYISNSRTKHIERRHLKIRELVEQLAVRPEFVPTDENVADIMTKPLGRNKFEKFRRVLLNHE